VAELDELSKAILGAIRIHINKVEEVAKVLNVDKKIVKERVEELRNNGYIKGRRSFVLTAAGFKEATPPKIPVVRKSGGSTGGGFLIGVGVVMLLICVGALFLIQQYYTPMYYEVVEWKGGVETLYGITHSPGYDIVERALESLSPFTQQISNVLRTVPVLSGYADLIEQISSAADIMRRVRSASEQAYSSFRMLESYPPERLTQYIQWGLIGSISLLVIGVALRARAPKYAFTKPS